MVANSDNVNLLHIIFCLHVERERLLAKVCEYGVGPVINYKKYENIAHSGDWRYLTFMLRFNEWVVWMDGKFITYLGK
jgi:hypothetical protein